MVYINILIGLLLVMLSLPSCAVTTTIDVFGDDVDVLNVLNDGAKYIYHPNGVLEITDNYPGLQGYCILDTGNQQGQFVRYNSLFSLTLRGERYGHTLTLQGKLLNTYTSFPAMANTNTISYFSDRPYVNNGCQKVLPSYDNKSHQRIEIEAGDSYNQDCSTKTLDRSYPYTEDRNKFTFNMASRTFSLNLGILLDSPEFKNAHPDSYLGEIFRNLEGFDNRVGGVRDFGLYVQARINKKAFFRGVRLGQRQLPFNITYNTPQGAVGVTGTDLFFEGQISPHNTIDVQLSSSNRFSLAQETGDATIPYQANIRFNGQLLPLNHRQAAQPQILTGWNSVEGVPARLEFTFNQPNHTLVGGSYQDTLTLMANLSLN